MRIEEYYALSFENLPECTEYYYQEISKLNHVPNLQKKYYKKMDNLLSKSMYDSVKLVLAKQAQSNIVIKSIDNEDFKSFMNKFKSEKRNGFLAKFKSLFKRKHNVEVLTSDEKKMLDDSSSQASQNLLQTQSDQNSNTSEKSNQGSNQSQTKISKQRSDSCDDEPMDF